MVVTATPEVLRREAEQLFRSVDVPASLAFFEVLSPLHQRLFLVELWEALSRASIGGTDADLVGLVEVIDGWEATADLDAAPEVLAEIRRSKAYRSVDVDALSSQ